MTATRIALSVGILGLALWMLLAALGQQAMPSYLAAWLFCMALPLGALPLVMLLELLDVQGWALTSVLRRLLLLLPAGALFAIPVMLDAVPLYHRPGLAEGLPGWWMEPRFLLVRMAVMLLVWTGLAMVFCRTPRHGPRRGRAVVGLLLHLPLGSLAALDWLMSLDPGLGSSAFGLLVIMAQVGTALCAAVFVLAVSTEGQALPDEIAPLMAAALGAWMFLHFIQYLVVWSANLPGEIVWYQSRTLGLGAPAVWFGFAAAVLALAALLLNHIARTPWIMASVAAMLLLMHLIETLWLVTPPFRDGFSATLPDMPALLGLGGLAVFMLLVLPRAPWKGVGHGHA